MLAGWVATFPLLIHKEQVKTELVNSFAAATGMQLDIQGDVSLKIFPVPHLSINSLGVPLPQGKFLVSINNVDIWPVFTSLFTQVVIRKMDVNGVEINIEEMADGRPNWQSVSSYWQNGVFQRDAAKASPDARRNIPFQLSRARINYTFKSGTTISLENLGASWTTDASQHSNNFDMNFNFRNRPVSVSARIGGSIEQLFSQDNASVELNAGSGKDALQYKGTAGFRDNRATLNGNLSLTTEDIAYLVNIFRGQTADTAIPADYKALPVSMKMKLATQDKKMTISDIALDGSTIKGTARVDIIFPYQANIKANIKTLNLQDIVANGLFNSVQSPVQAEEKSVYIPLAKKTDTWNITSDLTIDDILYNNHHLTGTGFSAEINGDEATIPQFISHLPGEGRIQFSGIGRMAQEGMNIEGQIDAQGADFIQTMALLDTSGLSLPPQDFKRFHIRANMNVSPGRIRWSELSARMENTTVMGGMIAEFGKRTSLRAAFGISGLNLDHIASLWGIGAWQSTVSSNSIFGRSDGVMTVWLKHLGYDLNINSTLDNYVLNGKLYDKSDVNLSATANKITLKSDDLRYNDSHIAGVVSLDVSKDVPKLDISANVDKANATDVFEAFIGAKTGAAPVAGNSHVLWPTETLDLKWFSYLNAGYNMKFGHLVCDKLEADNVGIAGTIVDRKMSIDNLSANFYGASTAAKILIDSNSIPSVNASANLSSLRVERLAQIMPVFKGMSGLFNVNMALSTNGVNIQSMMTNLRGSVGVGGRDIEVHGFNLPAIVHAVSYVRTVADILGTVKRAFPNGDTIFSVFEGSWTLSQGVAETSQTKLLSQQAEGTLIGKADLVNWTTNTGINFALKTLDPGNPPIITVTLSGDLNNTAIDFDTHLLEQYVNNKTSENMLHQYGGHQ